MTFTLTRMRRVVRGGGYAVEFTGPSGSERVKLRQVDAELQAEIGALLEGREGQEVDAARARFLSELFPRWPADRETLLAFAEGVGHVWEWGPEGLSDRGVWYALFGVWPP